MLNVARFDSDWLSIGANFYARVEHALLDYASEMVD